MEVRDIYYKLNYICKRFGKCLNCKGQAQGSTTKTSFCRFRTCAFVLTKFKIKCNSFSFFQVLTITNISFSPLFPQAI